MTGGTDIAAGRSTPASTTVRAEAARVLTQAVLTPGTDLDRLDALVREAAVATWSPVAVVSMMTDRQVTAGVHVVDEGSETWPTRGATTPFEDTVCVLALRDDGPVRVSDATADERVAGIPSAIAGLFRSYLGSPLRTPDGAIVGVLCVYDRDPRAWSEENEAELDRLAGEVSVELRRLEDDRDRPAGAPVAGPVVTPVPGDRQAIPAPSPTSLSTKFS